LIFFKPLYFRIKTLNLGFDSTPAPVVDHLSEMGTNPDPV